MLLWTKALIVIGVILIRWSVLISSTGMFNNLECLNLANLINYRSLLFHQNPYDDYNQDSFANIKAYQNPYSPKTK